jgi:hypothetical protein
MKFSLEIEESRLESFEGSLARTRWKGREIRMNLLYYENGRAYFECNDEEWVRYWIEPEYGEIFE